MDQLRPCALSVLTLFECYVFVIIIYLNLRMRGEGARRLKDTGRKQPKQNVRTRIKPQKSNNHQNETKNKKESELA